MDSYYLDQTKKLTTPWKPSSLRRRRGARQSSGISPCCHCLRPAPYPKDPSTVERGLVGILLRGKEMEKISTMTLGLAENETAALAGGPGRRAGTAPVQQGGVANATPARQTAPFLHRGNHSPSNKLRPAGAAKPNPGQRPTAHCPRRRSP